MRRKQQLFYCDATEGKVDRGEKLVDGQDLIGLKYVQYVVHVKI